jgi:peptidoglycan/xylan/chitin deacetylase (PgdA/CDA1 family)
MANVAKFPKETSLFRPPYGKATFRQRRALHRMGFRLIYWDVLTRDYDRSVTPETMLARIKRETRPGSIINFHDSLKSNERMLAVLPLAIEWLLAQGYTLRTLD